MVTLRYATSFKGAIHKGPPTEEALENIKDAIRLHVKDRLESGEEIPQADSVSLMSLEVAV